MKELRHDPSAFSEGVSRLNRSNMNARVSAWIGFHRLKPPITTKSISVSELRAVPTVREGRLGIFDVLSPHWDARKRPGNPKWGIIGVSPDEVREIAQSLVSKNGWRKYAFKRLPKLVIKDCDYGFPFRANYPVQLLADVADEICRQHEKLDLRPSAKWVRVALTKACFELPGNCFYRIG
jgi:hypothetical protein